MSIDVAGATGRPPPRTGEPLLAVEDLVMHYTTSKGDVHAVDDVSLTLHQGEALGLVGESGCGKTSLALALLRLLPENGRIVQGRIVLDGVDLVALSEEEMRRRRWSDIAMVFQGAMNAWNPVYTIARQIEEAMRAHEVGAAMTRRDARTRIGELFELVGLPPRMMDRYPHEYSGGMRQRAVIAMALSCDPRIIIADEPTTALDVIVQDRILKELKRIQRDLDMAIIYISHDIAVIAEVADRIGVMYAGKMVEIGETAAVFGRPRNPYAWSLLTSTPSIRGARRRLAPLVGEPPDLMHPPPACRFHPRCPLASDRCRQEEPPLAAIPAQDDQRAACWHWEQVPAPDEAEVLG